MVHLVPIGQVSNYSGKSPAITATVPRLACAKIAKVSRDMPSTFGGPMRKVKVSRVSLALILFFMTGLATTRNYAQQPPAAPGQASSASAPATPSANATPDPASTPAVPPDKVVIKVGDTQVTAADFDFLLHTL